MLGLRERGVDVRTASVRRAADADVLSDLHRAERERTHALLPAGARRLLSAHARALRTRPRAYLATLAAAVRLAHAGGRARVWQLFYFAEAMLLWDWMRAEGLRHVHVHFVNVASDVALLACRFDPALTWSFTVHGPVELLDVESHKLALKASDAAAVVCISDFARSQVAAVADPGARLHTVRCGIDASQFAPRPRTGRGRTILCVGALSRRKGHAVLLEACARVPGARLVLAGDGPERERLEARAAELGADVTFLGAVGHDRVAGLYAEADVFCLPSFAEGVPTVLMEAMAMEVPVVATAIMGVPELVEDGRSGLLVPPARADRLAEALIRILDDPELARRLGRAGREKVLADYERGGAVAALHAVLRPLLTAAPNA